MEIKRDLYLNKLIRKKNNGLIKIVTGIRRCGKSYLLFHLFHKHLLEDGVKKDHIIEVALDDRSNKELRDPDNMLQFIKERIADKETYYIILDKVQLLDEFEEITEFRGRGDEIRVYTLSFREFVSVYTGSLDEAWDEYFNYGGLPFILSMETVEDKIEYLTSLFQKVYLSDIIESNKIRNKDELDELVDILASAVGSLTNPSKLAKTFKSVKGKVISDKTLKTYIDYLIDAFLISKAKRFDIKGKRYIGSPAKYYFDDVGLRNARLNFRQVEVTHIIENIIYNELRIRGYRVDVGIVPHYSVSKDGKRQKRQLEVDFVATRGSEKYYIQSAFAMNNEEKVAQEQRSLIHIADSFKKMIIVADNIKVRRNEEGIVTMGLRNFLLDENSLKV